VGIRRTVSTSLTRVVGPERTARLKRADARLRERMITALDVEGDRVSRAQLRSTVQQARAEIRAKVQSKAERAAQARKPAKKPAKKKLSRAELIEEIGRQSPEGVSHRPTKALPWASPDPSADFPKVTSTRHLLLAGLHEQMRPRTYFEIGVSLGNSLAQSRTRSIGVDPAYRITAPIHCDVQIVRETSDDFFASEGAFDHFGGLPVELGFIDGMHLAEYVLRDFMNTEKHMSPGGVVILDDMLPRNSLEAYRIRRTRSWTGDVYKVHEVLARYRPDLTLIPISTYPTGSYLVVGLDPANTVLDEHYDEIEPTLTGPDPQVVPQEWLERRTAVDAERVLGLDLWTRLAELHHSGTTPTRGQVAPLWQQLRDLPTVWEQGYSPRSTDDQPSR